MKHLKTYEQNINEPQVGDYVICKEDAKFYIKKLPTELVEFISKHIGKYIDNTQFGNCYIKYKHVPVTLLKNHPRWFTTYLKYGITIKNCRIIPSEEIIYWSPNKKDCEIYLTSNMYNL